MATQRVPRVDPGELEERLARGEPVVVVVVDVRGRSYAASERQIPGAVRIPPRELESGLRRLPRGASIVAYCT